MPREPSRESPRVSIRCLRQEDLEEVLALMRLGLGEGSLERSLGAWNWKHRANPFGPSPACVAWAQGRIVGLRVFQAWSWRRGQEHYPARRAVDTVTHPRWQGRGIFRDLTRHLLRQMDEEEVAFVYNTPNRKSRRGYLAMGWQDVGRAEIWLRPLPGSGLRLVAEGPGDARAETPDPLAEVSTPVQDVLKDPFLIPFLERVWDGERRLHTARNREYLAWRYAGAPGLEYRALRRFEPPSGALLIVRHRWRKRWRECLLSEVMVTPDEGGITLAKALVRELVRRARAHVLAATVARGTAEHRVVRQTGFLPLPWLGPRFTVRPLHSCPLAQDLSQWSSWRLSLGDLEIF